MKILICKFSLKPLLLHRRSVCSLSNTEYKYFSQSRKVKQSFELWAIADEGLSLQNSNVCALHWRNDCAYHY